MRTTYSVTYSNNTFVMEVGAIIKQVSKMSQQTDG